MSIMMTMRRRAAATLTVVAVAFTGACGSGDSGDEPGPTSTATPTTTATGGDTGGGSPSPIDGDVQALVAVLLGEDDMGASWGPPIEPGVIPDEAKEFTSGVPIECPAASEDLRQPQWQVQTMFLATDDAVGDVGGLQGVGLSQRIYAGSEEDAVGIYAGLQSAIEACVGPLSEEAADGPAWEQLVELSDLPTVGDEALRVWMGTAGVDPEAGDATVTVGRMVVVRSGGLLMYIALPESVHVDEFTGEWPEPIIPDAELDAIVATAVAKLG
ncbi:hypothetical protein [Demequina lignilytica]|uniref:PknH-like extracellular domain-containing protein n=1 Tax=Demequina lignilytica TaxID=3051663 RepID=A0AB35MDT1_9MICO|nr:hypothetical protein [Demequina sp. SYSU T0a273]MDN4481921.1 hypothetical protein [Demequina sp. SYSU T0a273]